MKLVYQSEMGAERSYFFSLFGCWCCFLYWFLIDNIQHLSLDCFFFKDKPILVPDEIWCFYVKAMPLHTSFKKTNDVAVVRILCKREASAVVHKFFELVWLLFAQVFNCCFFLLLFDGSILFSLGSAGQTLPWQRSHQEIENNVTDCF